MALRERLQLCCCARMPHAWLIASSKAIIEFLIEKEEEEKKVITSWGQVLQPKSNRDQTPLWLLEESDFEIHGCGPPLIWSFHHCFYRAEHFNVILVQRLSKGTLHFTQEEALPLAFFQTWRYCLWSAPSFASIQWDLSYALQEGRYCTSLKWGWQPLLEYEAPCWAWFPSHWQRWLSETHLGWPGRYSVCYLSENNHQKQGTQKSSDLQIYKTSIMCNRALSLCYRQLNTHQLQHDFRNLWPLGLPVFKELYGTFGLMISAVKFSYSRNKEFLLAA